MYPQMHHPHCGCGCKRTAVEASSNMPYPPQPRPMSNQPYPTQTSPMSNMPYPTQTSPMSNQPYPTQTSPFAQPPVVLPPLCRYTDSFSERELPVIQPLIDINRHHIVDVPKTYYERIQQNVLANPSALSPSAVSPAHMNPFCGRNKYPRC